MAFLRRNLPKMAVGDVEIFIGRNLSYVNISTDRIGQLY